MTGQGPRDQSTGLSSAVINVLRAAGWSEAGPTPQRLAGWLKFLVTEGYVVSPVARAALARYGGLKVEVGGPGFDTFRTSFDLRPELTQGEAGRFADFSSILGVALVPLGELDHGHAFLAIGADGRVLWVSTEVGVIGSDMNDAIENMVLGRKP